MDIKNELKSRNIPPLLRFNNGNDVRSPEEFEKRKSEIKKLLSETVYGYIPKKPEHLRADTTEKRYDFAAGAAHFTVYNLVSTIDGKEFSFRLVEVLPLRDTPVGAFIYPSFSDTVPNIYYPAEEIADRGYAVYTFSVGEITGFSDGFKDGLSKFFIKGKRKHTDPGKIALWAWACIRVLEFLLALDYIDKNNIAVVGHAEIAEAALLAAAFDERFKYTIVNSSDALSILRGNAFSKIADKSAVFRDGYSTRYRNFSTREDTLPFDMHFLPALIAPRYLLVGTAKRDTVSDNDGTFLSLVLSSEAYKLYGEYGLIHNGKFPKVNCPQNKGNILFNIRNGFRYFTRSDWNLYMDFIDSKSKEKST